MATRKQKHERALAKREKWLEQRKQDGLKALAEEKKHREQKIRDAHRPKHDKKHSWQKIDKNCLLCQDLLAEQNRQQKLLNEERSALEVLNSE